MPISRITAISKSCSQHEKETTDDSNAIFVLAVYLVGEDLLGRAQRTAERTSHGTTTEQDPGANHLFCNLVLLKPPSSLLFACSTGLARRSPPAAPGVRLCEPMLPWPRSLGMVPVCLMGHAGVVFDPRQAHSRRSQVSWESLEDLRGRPSGTPRPRGRCFFPGSFC